MTRPSQGVIDTQGKGGGSEVGGQRSQVRVPARGFLWGRRWGRLDGPAGARVLGAT